MADNRPLVSVGLPTYNRASSLRRAAQSVLAQDYRNIELVISNNASTDETEFICKGLREQDERVRYVCQLSNRGAVANFSEVVKQSQGEFFMWLADDDWLDRSYISQCLQVLIEQTDHALVCGKGRFFEGEKFVLEGEQINLLQDSGEDRVLTYYQKVDWNATFYGVMRREQLMKIPIQNTLGVDWLLVASIAFMGKVRTLESVCVNRSRGGMSKNVKDIILRCGLPRYQIINPHLSIAISVFKDIVWTSPAYRSIRWLARMSLGYKAFSIISRRYPTSFWWRVRTILVSKWKLLRRRPAF